MAPLAILIIYGSGTVIDWITRPRIKSTDTQGVARYPGHFLAMGIAIGLGIPLLITLAVVRTESVHNWMILFVVALFGAGVSVHALRAWLTKRWMWDEEGVTYVSGKRVTTLRWDDITGGKWLIGGWRIYGPSGAVSCWHNIVGYYALSDALVKHRPDLARVTHLRA